MVWPSVFRSSSNDRLRAYLSLSEGTSFVATSPKGQKTHERGFMNSYRSLAPLCSPRKSWAVNLVWATKNISGFPPLTHSRVRPRKDVFPFTICSSRRLISSEPSRMTTLFRNAPGPASVYSKSPEKEGLSCIGRTITRLDRFGRTARPSAVNSKKFTPRGFAIRERSKASSRPSG